MALPSDVLKAESRATGFGLYYSIFYLGMGTLPALAGGILDRTGSIPAVIWLSALCLMLAPAFYIAARLLHGHANPS
jgi:predicted MFS family arabinose efflux permease